MLIAVLVYILSRQETQYALLWTGGIMAAATVYWALYLRSRQDTRWLVTLPRTCAPDTAGPANSCCVAGHPY